MFLFNVFTALLVATIVAQVPHVYSVFDSFSRLNGWLKITQSVAFCLIVSVAIFAFSWAGKPTLALIGAGIEMIVNFYYYTQNYWQRRGTVIDLRKQWIALLFGILLPIMIFIFSEQLRVMG
jgi:hypothetical protein